jgi:hypothetical protein
MSVPQELSAPAVFSMEFQRDRYSTSGEGRSVPQGAGHAACKSTDNQPLVSVQEVFESFESLSRSMKNVLEVVESPMSQ